MTSKEIEEKALMQSLLLKGADMMNEKDEEIAKLKAEIKRLERKIEEMEDIDREWTEQMDRME